MAITLNGTTGITSPDINVTAQTNGFTTTGNLTAADLTLSGGVYLGGTGSANHLSIGGTINGLPFTARNGQEEYPMTSNIYHNQSVTYSGSRTTAVGYVLKNTTNMDLLCVGSAQTVGSLTFSTSGNIFVTGQYYTNA
jgi:hypothetical protein